MTKQQAKEQWAEVGMDIDQDCVCNNCDHWKICEYAWDLYNFNCEPEIDCLAAK